MSTEYDVSRIADYSETCVRQPPLRLTLVVDVERWLSYKGTCHVILLAKLHDMYLYKTATFPHLAKLHDMYLYKTATFPHQPFLFKVCQGWLSYTGFTVDVVLFMFFTELQHLPYCPFDITSI